MQDRIQLWNSLLQEAARPPTRKTGGEGYGGLLVPKAMLCLQSGEAAMLLNPRCWESCSCACTLLAGVP